MVDVLVIFGPNLNMLGTREPEIYGADSMADIMGALSGQAVDLGRRIEMMQSNDEGVLVTAIQKARSDAAAILFNLAAFKRSQIGGMSLNPAVRLRSDGPGRRRAIGLAAASDHDIRPLTRQALGDGKADAPRAS